MRTRIKRNTPTVRLFDKYMELGYTSRQANAYIKSVQLGIDMRLATI